MEANGQKETEKPSLINISLENLGTVNKNQVIIKNGNKTLSLYFSYNTIVGFNLQILQTDLCPSFERFNL